MKKNFCNSKKVCIFAPKIKQKPDGRPSKEATNTMTITRKQIEAATEKANGFASPYKMDVLNPDGLAALMEIVWAEMDGCKIADFFDVFGSFLGRRHLSTWFDDVYKFAEAKKAAYKAQKSSIGIADLSQWYIIK